MWAVRTLAVDWSGRARGANKSIWLAEARDGRLVSLEGGRDRRQVIERVIEIARKDRETLVGFDFGFSFPGWWCAERSWSGARDVWAAMADEGEQLLRACEPPFWGRPGKRRPRHDGYRKTELEGTGSAKSVFQIGGAGAVGTGSIRGMPFLLALADAGFTVWPFDQPEWPCVIEIYPRELTGSVTKSDGDARRCHLRRSFPNLEPEIMARAAGSEDAFDAAVSALAMDRHIDDLAALQPLDGPYGIEGAIWRPTRPTQASCRRLAGRPQRRSARAIDAR